ncbi:response regulator [Wenzhouxiangella sp. XN201]|uniref:response regulator n=1 Tax=Wenzhouxiangella sp. XN201 TaxID=2710755 RepID=UPI0013C5BA55|nr:response regulator [Wenzhouxiangella sp. XN201]NEZ02661.1 response regulator [Wenzhouxiangella sp. XN201]
MPHVLLVEDNEMNQNMLSRRLRRQGYEVDVAADGEQAIAMVAERRPDIILMDIGLPGRDGHDITRELKASESSKSIPIIALTAHAMKSDRDKAMAAGCDDYDTKPVEMERLLTKMQAALSTVQLQS